MTSSIPRKLCRKRKIIIDHELKNEKEFKQGNLVYFKTKLIKNAIITNENGNKQSPLGEDVVIEDIIYHKGRTDSYRKHGEYYVEIRNARNEKLPPKNIPISFTTNRITANEETGKLYYTSIYQLLNRMNDLNTLDLYQLRPNYNHYHTEPIMN